MAVTMDPTPQSGRFNDTNLQQALSRTADDLT